MSSMMAIRGNPDSASPISFVTRRNRMLSADGFPQSVSAAPAAATVPGSPPRLSSANANAAVREDDTQQELARLSARVQELEAQLVRSNEALRSHLARELHDGVGAELTAARFALAGIETWLPATAPPQCVAALAEANRAFDSVCAATRDALTELNAPLLDDGIVQALTHWAHGFARRTGLRAHFTCPPDERLLRLSDEAALAIFRVAQEALNNAAKHARAFNVDIRIETSPRHLTLMIRDDGIGLPPHALRARRHGSFGLAGMRLRCEALGGSLRARLSRPDVEIDEAVGAQIHARFAWQALLTTAPELRARVAS
ncbi:histidine kinase [Paraburkholderia bonniea]|uniref:sensor histidine kinase n=1 Tax=Paraburkholderia bonniea TaxID=2152891 RepID=UPI002573C917|nr:ATP-binding protein [Paraburkholderia bonniea]WJF90183.1 histidine kinase [Paraburkholderia bonniea]WJF93497.1 histidine kinase [Paraburkholderia bonniea]